MEPDLAELRKNYERFTDEKIIRIATEDAAVLRPEALEILKQVLKDRGLSESISKGINAQLEEIDEAAVLEYAELLRDQPCPICGSANEKLNATITLKVYCLIMCFSEKELIIACPNCLDELNRNAMFKSGLLGWWAIPWGVIKTIQSLNLNKKMLNSNRLPEANDLLKAFVYERIGRIEANRNNPAELQLMIKYIR